MSPRSRKPPPPLTDLEGEIMREVWAGASTVREVLESLNAAGTKQRAYTTVMTVMSRLDQKGILRRKRRGKTDLYRAVLTRQEYLDRRAEAEVGALVDQFGDVALVHFARQIGELDPERARQLRALARGD